MASSSTKHRVNSIFSLENSNTVSAIQSNVDGLNSFVCEISQTTKPGILVDKLKTSLSRYNGVDNEWSLVDHDVSEQSCETESMIEDTVLESAAWYFTVIGNVLYVRMEEGRVSVAVWCRNVNYVNWWSELTPLDCRETIRQLYDAASSAASYFAGGEIAPSETWTANGHIVRLHPRKPFLLPDIPWWLDMLNCVAKDLTDDDQVRYDGSAAPRHFLVNTEDFPRCPRDKSALPWSDLLPVAKSKETLGPWRPPIDLVAPLSCSVSDDYSDVLIPNRDDWRRCSEPETAAKNLAAGFEQLSRWKDRKSVAVFRGSPSGRGTRGTTDTDGYSRVNGLTNQRLLLVGLSNENPDLIDASITRCPSTIKLVGPGIIDRSRVPSEGGVDRIVIGGRDDKFLSIQEQASRYKYAVCVEGHVAAFRLADLFEAGLLVLRVASKWKVWYDVHLTAWKHYVPVSADLSDLKDRVLWCRQNDDKCLEIAKRAHAIASQITSNREATLKVFRVAIQKHASKVGPTSQDALRQQPYSIPNDVWYLQQSAQSVELRKSLPLIRAAVKSVYVPKDSPDWDRLAALIRQRRGQVPFESDYREYTGPTRAMFVKPLSSRCNVISVFSGIYTLVVENWPADSRRAALHATRGLLEFANTNFAPKFVHAQRLMIGTSVRFVVWREFLRGQSLSFIVSRSRSFHDKYDEHQARLVSKVIPLVAGLRERGYRLRTHGYKDIFVTCGGVMLLDFSDENLERIDDDQHASRQASSTVCIEDEVRSIINQLSLKSTKRELVVNGITEIRAKRRC